MQGSPGAAAGLIIGRPFDVPAVQLLDGGEQLEGEEAARNADPEVIAADARSRTEFSRLPDARVAAAAAAAFPEFLYHRAGGPPALGPSEAVGRYLTERSAILDDAGGAPAVLESAQPIAAQLGGRGLVPLDLSLQPGGRGFHPRVSATAVSIPTTVSRGVALPGLGIALVPVGRTGTPLHGSGGAVVGSSVLYANTEQDADTIAKPSASGVEIATLLRSASSPQILFFRLVLPAGATLRAAEHGGPVAITAAGRTIATIQAPAAFDAAGDTVPASMSVSGSTLAVSVPHRGGEYRYPIAVDPEITDTQLTEESGRRANWQFVPSNGHFSGEANASLKISGSGVTTPGEFAFWAYQTKGNSHIWQFTSETEAHNAGAGLEGILELEAPPSGANEGKVLLSAEAAGTAEYSRKVDPVLCPTGGCSSSSGAAENAVHYQLSATGKGTGSAFNDTLFQGAVALAEPPGTHATTTYNTTSPEIEFEVEPEPGKKEKVRRSNALAGAGSWISKFQGAIELIARDPGIGVSSTRLEYENAGRWEALPEHNYLTAEKDCQGVQCFPEHREAWTLNPALPNGEDRIRYRAHDAMPGTESPEAESIIPLKVDHSPPHDIHLLGLPPAGQIREAAYTVTATATDGEGATISSAGIRSISLFVDGHEVGKPGGACSVPKGECTGGITTTVSGAELGAGTATVVIVAVDNAGNERREGFLVNVVHSKPVSMGPGSLNLESGGFSFGATDVAAGNGLTVGRTYSSRNLSAGSTGPLGPQWSLSLGNSESMLELGEGSLELTGANGSQSLFLNLGEGHYESPLGDSNLTLNVEENAAKTEKLAYYLRNSTSHTSVKFTRPSGSTVWVPSTQEGAVPTDTVTYRYQTVEPEAGKKVTEPLEALGPVPAGVSCPAGKLQPGCRALTFVYSTATNAGEHESEWGAYAGRLSKVVFTAYNPATKAMLEITVALYSYDAQGRLRAVWDPRVAASADCATQCAALKTIYGYDAEGHVTALQPPGQEPWLMTYGTVATDAGAGRLMKLTRSSASAPLPTGDPPQASEAPALSGSPVVGNLMGVSPGSWTGSPAARSYQWEDCNSSGLECARIAGATAPNYTPTLSDAGHRLVARITVTNGRGSGTATPISGTVIPAPEATVTGGFSHTGTTCSPPREKGCMEGPRAIARGSNGNLWVDEGCLCGNLPEARVQLFTPAGEYRGEIDARLSVPDFESDVALEPNNNAWIMTEKGVEQFTATGEHLQTVGPTGAGAGQISRNAAGVAVDPGQKELYVADSENHRLDVFSTSGAFQRAVGWGVVDGAARLEVCTTSCQAGVSGAGQGQLSTPVSVTVAQNGDVWVGDIGNSRVEEFTPGGELVREFGREGVGSGQFRSLGFMSIGPRGVLFVLDRGNNRVQEFNEQGEYLTQILLNASDPSGIFVDPEGHMWVTEGPEGTRAVREFTLAPVTEGTRYAPPPEPGTTIEYNVPLSGSGLPTMTGTEVARWGQTDDPVEATAVIPPDSPQGWPASSYTRATVYYLDAQGGLVNESSPSNSTYGTISTTEYNEVNDVVRTLTAANRVAALEAGSRSAEVARLLDSESVYNGERPTEGEVEEPGTQLVEQLGPQHVVKYKAGNEVKESLARKFSEYVYDQGAPTETTHERYDLLTEEATLAALANRERVEVRTTRTSYGDQGTRGWKIGLPTSVTNVDSEGKTITHETLYDEAGRAIETRGAMGLTGSSAHDERTIYYTSGANSEGFAACGNHPEWNGLVCETLPARQPETTGAPKLPETITTYNIWDEPEVVEETHGVAKRTKRFVRDPGGRVETSEASVSGAKDKALPKVTNTYSPTTGSLATQSTTENESTRTVKSVFNTLGQRVSYTDADGNTATYRYGDEKHDDLLEEVTDGSNGGTAKQTYGYDPTTKRLITLTDSAAGSFTASYDAEGRLMSEVYPNHMCAVYTYDSVGETVHLEYIKTSNCTETKAAIWFSESRTPGIRGETFASASTLASESYRYDGFGRLAEVREQPAGEGCSERLYEYDEESNRTSQTTRKPGTGGVCATGGGTVVKHTYDEANHLTDTGVAYEELANATKMPAADAEKAAVTSTYYVDGAVATQLQGGIVDSYSLDPTGRVRETLSEEKLTKTVKSRFVSHYDAPGGGVAWTSEGEQATRNIPGIDGSLCAVQKNAETPVLQLHDVNGDTVATVADSPEATALLSTYNSTEFGVPSGGKPPPQYAWLGGYGISSERQTGIITDGTTSYVPQIGRTLQGEEVEPPGLPYGSGGGEAYVGQLAAWNVQGADRAAAEAPGLEAGREREAAEAACLANPAACIVDPEGLVSGNEALTLAHELEDEASKIKAYREAGWCGHAFNPTACALALESGELEDNNLGKALEECHFQVSNPGYLHGHYYTKTCLLDFSYEAASLHYRLVEPGWHVNICFSFYVGRHSITYSSSSWYCGSDRRWWTFGNRGFWKQTQF